LRIVEQQPEGMFIAWSLHWTSVQTWPVNALLCSAHGALLIFKTFFFQQVFVLLETCLRKKVFHGFGRKKERKPLGDLKGAYKKFFAMVAFLQRTNSAPRFCWKNLFQSPRGEIL
jgi:hypothetical protein